MKIDVIKEMAKQHQLKPGKANKGELIRAIQQARGEHSLFWQQQCQRMWTVRLFVA
jgi:hypothetical protein